MEASASIQPLSPEENRFLDLSERETANSLQVLNALLDPNYSPDELIELRETKIEDELVVFSAELDERWRGALFSLHPQNPEASRHFCSSSREILLEMIEIGAPDEIVLSENPSAALTTEGGVTRREKISYMVSAKGIRLPEAVDFAHGDVDDIVELVNVLNSGTHGESGRFSMSTLASIKNRVEDGIIFLSRIAG